jgi:hypothetical protein
MSHQTQTSEDVCSLPKDVRNLIFRKLRHLQQIQKKKWISTNQAAYSKLNASTSGSTRPEQIGRVFVKTALEAFQDITSYAEVVAIDWPETVWEVTHSILEKLNIQLNDGEELKEIIMYFTDAKNKYLSIINHIDPERHKNIVRRQAGRFGIIENDIQTELYSMIDREAKKAQCGVLNHSSLKQEDINFAIDEYIITKQRYINHNKIINKLSNKSSLQSNLDSVKNNTTNKKESVRRPDQPSDPFSRFRCMTALKFSEIHILIDPDKLVLRISARDMRTIASFNSIGLTRKNEVTLNRQGKIFMAMANGTSNPEEPGFKRAISRLSKSLREVFNISDHPFQSNKQQFHLSIPKDKDAKQRALKRTTTYNDTRKINETTAQDYFKKYDSDYDPNNPLYSDDPDLGLDN